MIFMDIELRNINKSFNGERIFHDFNTKIEMNKVTAIMGESGIGKTTLINMLLGLEKPDAGEILGINGRRIGVVFQEDRLCEEFDCLQNLRLVCSRDIGDKDLVKLLEDLGLGEAINKKVSTLSGGMKRRLAIGRALIFDADILIMDEPFKGLDKELYRKVMEEVLEKTKNKTLILVTHSTEEAKLLNADIIYIG